MDKLGSVREAIAQNDDECEEWGLEELFEKVQRLKAPTPSRMQFTSFS